MSGELRQYVCNKRVRAARIEQVADDQPDEVTLTLSTGALVNVDSGWAQENRVVAGAYYLIREDGGQEICQAAAFEADYTPVDELSGMVSAQSHAPTAWLRFVLRQEACIGSVLGQQRRVLQQLMVPHPSSGFGEFWQDVPMEVETVAWPVAAPASTLTVEVGKRYRRKDGFVTGEMCADGKGLFDPCTGIRYWPNGKPLIGFCDFYDLEREFTDAAR